MPLSLQGFTQNFNAKQKADTTGSILTVSCQAPRVVREGYTSYKVL